MPVRAFDRLMVMSGLEGAGDTDAPWVVLFLVFDGDADAWLRFLEREGSTAQRRDDLPLARAVAEWCDRNESFRLKLRALARRLRSRSH